MEREREESLERGERRVQTDIDTEVESTQSRQKKGQMKSIFLSDSDEEAIMEFVKQHEELYDNTNDNFKNKQKSGQEEYRTSDLVEGQFQFSTRSHQKEGSFQVFCIQVTQSSLQPQLHFQILPGTQNLRWKSALHQMLVISLQAPGPSDESLQSQLPPRLQIQS